MEVRIDYRVKGSTNSLLESVRKQVTAKVEDIVKSVVEEYISELEQHMGNIPGASAYKDEHVAWAPLELEPEEVGHKFWYETGETARAVVVNIRVTEKGVRIFAGIPSTSHAYEKALWNELGFTPQDGDHLIRRPLFIPVAEAHSEELRKRITDYVKTTKIRVSVPI